MPRGRKPKPQILPALQGRPEKPAHLEGVASAEWDRIIPILEAAGNLSMIDAPMLAVYCQSYAKWLICEQHIAEHGLMVTSPNGYEIQSPYVNIGKQCEKTMLSIAAQFGLSPRSRKAIKQTEAKPKIDDKWRDFA